jgi:hypothetical protein
MALALFYCLRSAAYFSGGNASEKELFFIALASFALL